MAGVIVKEAIPCVPLLLGFLLTLELEASKTYYMEVSLSVCNVIV